MPVEAVHADDLGDLRTHVLLSLKVHHKLDRGRDQRQLTGDVRALTEEVQPDESILGAAAV